MYADLRKRIAALIVGSASLVLVALLCVVFASEYASAKKRNRTMLERYAGVYTLEDAPVGTDDPSALSGALEEEGAACMDEVPPDVPLDDEDDDYLLSSFYSVAFDDAGEVLAVDVGYTGLYGRDELVRMAGDIARRDAGRGTAGALLYTVERREGYTLVAFIDNRLVDAGLRRLLGNMLVGAAATMLLILLASLPLSRALVRPLEENDISQRRFISDAGHELKTPISVIGVNAEVLARQVGANRWLDNIQYENRRMGELVARLLNLSHAQEGSAVRERLDLSELVKAGSAPFESVASEAGLALACSVQEGLVVEGDASQLAQLPAILLENAVEYARSGSPVGLTLRAENRVAVLEVVNQAEGLDGDLPEHAFERFFRADEARGDISASSGSTGHFGLGLPIAKAIAEGHGGSIGLTCRDGIVRAVVKIPLKA